MSFRLGIISDEISDDLEQALDTAHEWGLQVVELRTLWGKNVVDLTPAETARASSALERRGLVVEGIASPLFKSPLRDADPTPDGPGYFATDTAADRQFAVLGRALNIANALGARMVRAFSFWRRSFTTDERAEIVAHLRRAADMAEAEGHLLVLENEHTCSAATGAEAGALLAAVGSPNLRVIWDPGNAYVAGERAYPDGYRAVRGNIADVHIKDAVRAPAPDEEPWRLLGEGEVDWQGQIAALLADGYDGPLILEPHPIPGYRREESAYLCLQNLRRMLAEAAG